MQDLCPDYGPGWRVLDLLYLWHYKQALVSTGVALDPGIISQVLCGLVRMVRLRYFQLRLAELAQPHGFVDYQQWWQSYRVCQHNLAVSFATGKAMRLYSAKLWRNDTPRVVSSFIHAGDHETMDVRLGDETLDVIVLVDQYIETGHTLCDVLLALGEDTIWCSYSTRRKCDGVWRTTVHQRSLMQL